MSGNLAARVEAALQRPVAPEIATFAADLAERSGALAVLFYGSNLRTGSLEGVLDFYVLLPGAEEHGIWPRVSYHEKASASGTLRAKVATMTLATFAAAARGERLDTTIWARFVQPSAMAWPRDAAAVARVVPALAAAATTAARLAAALGPSAGEEATYWRALFAATYRAELRVEKAGREDSILALNAAHFSGLLPAALAEAQVPFTATGTVLDVRLHPRQKAKVLRWWAVRRRMGKVLNVVRLLKAATTFEGAARYAAWKIERHTGIAVQVTPFAERHPLLAAPAALWRLRQARRAAALARG